MGRRIKTRKSINKTIGDSVTYALFSGVSRFVKRMIKNSFLFCYVTSPVKLENSHTEKSNAYKILSFLAKPTKKANDKTRKILDGFLRSSFIVRYLYDFYSNILHQSLRTFGIIIVVGAVSYFSATVGFGGMSVFTLMVTILLIVISIPLIFSNSSVYDVMKSSRIVRFFYVEKESGFFSEKNTHTVYAVILGIAMAGMAVLLPVEYAAAGIASLFIVPFILIWPVLGLVGLAAGIAFVPTVLAAGLIIFTWLSVFLNSCTGRISAKSIFLKGRAVFVFLVIVLSGGIISFAVADSLKTAMIYVVFVSVVFLFIILVKNKFTLKTIIASAAIAALGTAFIGIYQYLSGNIEIGWIDSEMFEGMVRIYSTFENPNVYGEYLILSIPLCMAMFFIVKRLIYKLFWMGSGILLVTAMLLTMSRGCWIGLAVGVFIYFAIADRRFLWLFFGAAILMPFVLPESILTRLLSIGNLEDTSSLYRLYIWLGTFSMLKDYWFTGVGLGTKAFSGIYSAYSYNGVLAPHAHNLFLHIIAETGIMGLFGFIWVIFTGFKNSLSVAFKGDKFKRYIGAALAASLSGFLVQGVFDNVFYNYRIYLMFWVFIALTYAFALLKKERGEIIGG